MVSNKLCKYSLIIGIAVETVCMIWSLYDNVNILKEINSFNLIIICRALFNINYYIRKFYFINNNVDIKISLDDIGKFICVNILLFIPSIILYIIYLAIYNINAYMIFSWTLIFNNHGIIIRFMINYNNELSIQSLDNSLSRLTTLTIETNNLNQV